MRGEQKELEVGATLARSSGRKMRRESADALLERVLRRVERVNSAESVALGRERYPLTYFFVDNVRVFGSYLGTEPMIGDLDIAICCGLRSNGMLLTRKTVENFGKPQIREHDHICGYIKAASPRRVDLANSETILRHRFPNRLIYTRTSGRICDI